MDRLSDARALLPWQAGCIRLDTLTVEALLCLRHLEDEEGFERLTCRPVHLRGADELRVEMASNVPYVRGSRPTAAKPTGDVARPEERADGGRDVRDPNR